MSDQASPPIQTTEDLAAFCDRLKSAPAIMVDTEFMREKTYWPILCLVQVAGPDEAHCIDPLAKGMDLAPLFELFDNSDILKVFHAGRQDMEIFWHLAGRLPKPVFDTQIAAMVCGFGDSVSYENLVSKLAKAKIDKSSRFTDWSLRPLSQKQLNYALSDVTHLRVAYAKLKKKLDDSGRAHWLDDELATLTDPATYDIDTDRAFQRLKIKTSKPRFLAVLRELAGWREDQAKSRDLPRNRVLKDDQLFEVAHHRPKDARELGRTRGLGKGFAEGHMGESLLKAVRRGEEIPESEAPMLPARTELPGGLGPTTDLLKVLLKMKSEEAEVAQKLIASSADIDRIAAFGEDANVPAMHGWRREIFGEDALRLARGDVAVAIKNKRLLIVKTPD